MSTRINGYLIGNPHELLTALWPELVRARRVLERDLMATEACTIADRASFSGTVEESPVVRAYRKLTDGESLPTFKMYLGVAGDQHAAIVFATHELEEAFAALPGVQEYGYWNNTDRPDDVTKAQWDARKAFWDVVTPSGRLIETMLTWEMPRAGYELIEAGQDIEGHLPSIGERAKVVARGLVVKAADGDFFAHLWDLTDTRNYPELVELVAALMPDYSTPRTYDVPAGALSEIREQARVVAETIMAEEP